MIPPSPAPHRRRAAALAAGICAAGILSACGAVTVPPGPDAADPACAPIIQNAPDDLLGQPRQETSSQGTIAWGTGADTIVLRCGVTPPGPTTDLCTRIADATGISVDWIVHEKDGLVTFTTFGRVPAIDVTVPRSAAPDQPSAAVLDMTRTVSAIPATQECLGPGDSA
ncbi:DUF3515 family protein [Brachybacterium sp. AOP25-B2-12]|uniref:DUF3515 family protein n=1 Tax=Brachybacterium sp. AOP25-B2-12 TaxID=3457710 RepID=UPI00403387A2